MKNLALIILITLHSSLFTVHSFSQPQLNESTGQPCLPEGITFATQAEIDNFQTNYPGCTEIEGDVAIYDSWGGDVITNLEGLNVITSIGGDLEIGSNYALTSLSGLENLSTIAGDLIIGGNFAFYGNPALTDISSLANLAAASIDNLTIRQNTSLSTCEVQSISDYLVSPNGTVTISNNAPGCNSVEEVEEACIVGIKEEISSWSFTISPNPLESTTLIEYTLKNNSPVTLKILDLSGREMATLVNEVQQQGEQRVVFKTVGLKPGIYFCVLKTSEGVQTKKMVKR